MVCTQQRRPRPGVRKSLRIVFGVPNVLRSDGGSQLSSDMAERLKYLLKYEHLIIGPYHPQVNSMAATISTENAAIYSRGATGRHQ